MALTTSSRIDRFSGYDEKVRHRLQDAAIACVSELGFSKVRMRDIGDRVGLARQTVYNYYGSKHEVVAAAFMREGMEFAQEIAKHILSFDGLDNKFVEAFLFVLERFPKNPVLALVLDCDGDFLAKAGMSYWLFGDVGRVVFADVFHEFPYLAEQAEEISEYWSRNAMSFLTLRGHNERSREELDGYVRRRLLPGLCLQNT